jgi:hypothetical protein
MFISAAQLRDELTGRAIQYAHRNQLAFRQSYFEGGSVVFLADEVGSSHGNFHPASYRSILARRMWHKRLSKVLTVNDRLRDVEDTRRLCELDSCCSSDALLMNIFCHPKVRSSPKISSLLGVDHAVPIFGWRARVPMLGHKFDRTEVDMKLGTLLVEAKLTESGFENCSVARMRSYTDFQKIFRLGDLPRSRTTYRAYQLLRNVLAAHAHQTMFCLLTDARRSDLMETWFQVISAIKPLDLRLRCKALTWQELAAELPSSLQRFLKEKYGIEAAVAGGVRAVGY